MNSDRAGHPAEPMPSSKNILLINPWIYDFTAYDFWMRPLGLLYIAALLKKHTDLRLSFIDCLNRNHPSVAANKRTRPDLRGPFHKEEVPKPSVLKDIPRRYSRYGISLQAFRKELDKIPVPDAVLITSVMSYWYPGVQAAVESIREKWDSVPIILGGIYATLLPGHARRSSGADAVVEGPGERKIFSVLRGLLGDEGIPDISLERLEDLPYPEAGLAPNREVLPLLTSRGCPYACTYCASRLLYSGFEQRSPLEVVDEIEGQHREHGTEHFAFYDDALLINRGRHIIPMLEEVIRRNLSLSFHTPNGLHIREVDRALASLFRAAGVRSIFLSQEALSEDVMADSGFKVLPGELERAMDALEHAGYARKDVSVYLMCGIPGQDSSDVIRDIRHTLDLGARPRLCYFSPVPGTLEWDKLVEQGLLRPDSDPLLTNKMVFPYVFGGMSPEEFDEVTKSIPKPGAA